MNKIFLFSVVTLLILGTIAVFIFTTRSKLTVSNAPVSVPAASEISVKTKQSESKTYSGIISGVSQDGSSLLLTSGVFQLSFTYSPETAITGPSNELVKASELVSGLSVDISTRGTAISSIKIKDFPYFIVVFPASGAPVDLNSSLKGNVKYGSGYLYYKIINRRTQSVYSESKLKLEKTTGTYGHFSLPLGLNAALDLIDQDTIDITLYDSPDLPSAKNKIALSYVYNGGLSSKIKIYVGGNKSECGSVVPVERLVNAARSPVRSSIEEIIKGLSDAEKSRGYFSPINNLTEIRSLDLRANVLYLDFTGNILEGLSTSCDIATARAEIFQTIKRFPDIKTIVITVDGNLKNPLSQ